VILRRNRFCTKIKGTAGVIAVPGGAAGSGRFAQRRLTHAIFADTGNAVDSIVIFGDTDGASSYHTVHDRQHHQIYRREISSE
jgi:hypothetical protein